MACSSGELHAIYSLWAHVFYMTCPNYVEKHPQPPSCSSHSFLLYRLPIPNALHSQKMVVCQLNLYGYLYGCRSRHPYTQSAYIDSYCNNQLLNIILTERGFLGGSRFATTFIVSSSFFLLFCLIFL